MSEAYQQNITIADDSFHAPPDPNDIYWTETCYFAFDREDGLSLATYPLFRPNMGICSLAVHVWDASGVQPWEIPYSKFQWHIPMPNADLTDLKLEGLTYKVVEPLKRYFVGFDDPGRLTMELEFEGIEPPLGSWALIGAGGGNVRGHLDQDCRVRGEMVLHGQRLKIDGMGHRDRSWHSRPDNAPRRSATVCYGVSEREQFLITIPQTLGSDAIPGGGVDGYLVRNGVTGHIVAAVRRVVERRETRPLQFEIEATDSLGRTIEATGRTNSVLAFNCSPPVFCWFSNVSWQTDFGSAVGEDQECYPFARIAPLIRASKTG